MVPRRIPVRVSRNVRRAISVTVAGAAVVGVAALPASAATGSTARPPAVVAQAQPAQKQQVRVDIAVTQASLPAGAKAIMVRNVTTGAIVGVYPLKAGTVTHVAVTVPAGTTLDVSALTAANA